MLETVNNSLLSSTYDLPLFPRNQLNTIRHLQVITISSRGQILAMLLSDQKKD